MHECFKSTILPFLSLYHLKQNGNNDNCVAETHPFVLNKEDAWCFYVKNIKHIASIVFEKNIYLNYLYLLGTYHLKIKRKSFECSSNHVTSNSRLRVQKNNRDEFHSLIEIRVPNIWIHLKLLY